MSKSLKLVCTRATRHAHAQTGTYLFIAAIPFAILWYFMSINRKIGSAQFIRMHIDP